MSLKRALITGGTANLAGPAGVMFLSLINNAKTIYTSSCKIFFHLGKLNAADRIALEGLDVICKDLSFILKGLNINYPYFSNAIVSKFLPFLLAEQGLPTIWLDSDQICIRDVSGILLDESYDLKFVNGGCTVSQQFRNSNSGLIASSEYSDINMAAEGICGNLYLIKNPPTGSCKFLLSHFERLVDNLYLGEQGIIDIFLQRQQSSVHRLNNELFTPHPNEWPLSRMEKADELPYFLHSWSRPKFWEMADPHPEYLKYYQDWIHIGGCPFR